MQRTGLLVGALLLLGATPGCGPRTDITVTVSGDAGGAIEVLRVTLDPTGAEPRTVTYWPDGDTFVLPATFVLAALNLAGEQVSITATAVRDGRDVAFGETAGIVQDGRSSAFDVVLAPIPVACGDGYADPGEACDGADLGGATCASEGFTEGTLGCGADCTLDTSGCSECGDLMQGGSEPCDGLDLGGATCASLGYAAGGTLSCAFCVLDVTGCLPPTPVPRRPMNGSYTGELYVALSLRPTFIWEPVAWGSALQYELEYSTDPAFPVGLETTLVSSSSAVYLPGANLVVSPSPPVGARYYWHVRACDGADCSAWSTTWWVNVGRSEKDFDGDGCADALVGSPGSAPAGPETGQAYAYRGELLPFLEGTADRTFAGEFAGDGFGTTAVAAGDLNGDGFGDLAVGAPGHDAAGADAGRVYVYFGGAGLTWDTVPEAILDGEEAGDGFGAALAPAGDVNGDGFADLLVGAPNSTAAGVGAGVGRAYVFIGAGGAFDPTPDAYLDGEAAGDAFGTALGAAGDLDGDGWGDIAIGAPGNDGAGTDTGRLYLYVGDQTGRVGPVFDPYADATLSGAAGSDELGAAIAGAGDINGDGFADLIAGAPQVASGGAGYAFVILGTDAVPLTLTPEAVLAGAASGDAFGGAVAGAGDVNDDGFDDLLAGAVLGDGATADEGTASLFFGGAGPSFDATPDAVLAGGATGAALGRSVAGAGDLNGDGFHDLIAGAPGNGSGGAAFVWFGNSGAVLDLTPDAALLGPAGELTGWWVAAPGTTTPVRPEPVRGPAGGAAVLERCRRPRALGRGLAPARI